MPHKPALELKSSRVLLVSGRSGGMTPFRDALREAVAKRVADGESMTAIAYHYGVSAPTVYAWLNGTSPKLEHYDRVCEVEGWPRPQHRVASPEERTT